MSLHRTLSVVVSGNSSKYARPALYIGLHGEAPSRPPARISLRDIEMVELARGPFGVERINVEGSRLLRLSLDDAMMSRQHARLTRIGAAWAIKDLSSKNGTWIDGARIDQRMLDDGEAMIVGHTAIVYRDRGGEELDSVGIPSAPHPGLITFSPETVATFADLTSASQSKVPIELGGESGTGKELAARAVHALSGRPGQFVAVNCGSLPGTLFEAELFGHRRGAYTGATEDRLGFVRAADRGTLFLDEIAELPSTSQAALLRVLQEGEVVPVGADRPIKIDLRVVTASLKKLDDEVAAGRFREDLRARLLGVRVELPPLRDRREDLGWLVPALLQRSTAGRELKFSVDALGAIYSYEWPLNIRELERALAAAVALTRDRIELNHLPQSMRMPRSMRPVAPVQPLSDEEQTLRDQLVSSLERNGGNISSVARELGKDRKQIQRWLKRFGLRS